MKQLDEPRPGTADATAIFAQHAVALERLAARITRDREDARDLVADAFAALLEVGPTEPGHAVPWLYLAVRHRAYNRIRDRARAKRRLSSLVVDIRVPVGPEPALWHDTRIRALLADAAAHLSERDRIAVSLRHLQEAPYDDVAVALGTTPAQARVVVHRATARLRSHVVSSLSRRHGVPDVSDEVVALLQGGALLPLSRPARVASTVREWWRRAQSTTGRAVVYIGEALAPAAALVAITAGPAVPVVPVPAMSSSPSVAAGAPIASVPTVDRQPAAHPVGSDVPSMRPSAPRLAVDATIGSPLHADDPGTSPGLAQSVDEQRRFALRVLGLTLDLPDPLDAPQGPEVDIRSVEVATIAGADGRAGALRFRLGFAAPPAPNVTAGLSWDFAGSACFARFNWPSGRDVSLACPQYRLLVGDFWFSDVSRVRAEVRVDDTVLEVVLPFGSLEDQGRALLHPGAQLVRIVASASCYVNFLDRSGCENADRAPDYDDGGDGYTYRVEE